MADEKPASPASAMPSVRATDFAEKYANNVRFESSVWELKAFFGTLDQGAPDPKAYPPSVKFHTSISLPWTQAKLMAYGACINVLWHERLNGRIPVLPSGAPPSVEKMVSDLGSTPDGKKLIELDALLRSVLFDAPSK